MFTPVPGRLPKVCGQQKARISRDELPYWQPDLYGSAEWYASYNRCNRIEGIFGNLKTKATQETGRRVTPPVSVAELHSTDPRPAGQRPSGPHLCPNGAAIEPDKPQPSS